MNLVFLTKTYDAWPKLFNLPYVELAQRPFMLRYGSKSSVDDQVCETEDLKKFMERAPGFFCKVTVNVHRYFYNNATVVAALTSHAETVRQLFHGKRVVYVYATSDAFCDDAFCALVQSLAYSHCPLFHACSVVYTGSDWNSEEWPVAMWNSFTEFSQKHYDGRECCWPASWQNNSVALEDGNKYMELLQRLLNPFPENVIWRAEEPKQHNMRRMLDPIVTLARSIKIKSPRDFKRLGQFETAHLVNVAGYAGSKASDVFWDANFPQVFADVSASTLHSVDDIDAFLENLMSTLGQAITRAIETQRQAQKEKEMQEE